MFHTHRSYPCTYFRKILLYLCFHSYTQMTLNFNSLFSHYHTHWPLSSPPIVDALFLAHHQSITTCFLSLFLGRSICSFQSPVPPYVFILSDLMYCHLQSFISLLTFTYKQMHIIFVFLSLSYFTLNVFIYYICEYQFTCKFQY